MLLYEGAPHQRVMLNNNLIPETTIVIIPDAAHEHESPRFPLRVRPPQTQPSPTDLPGRAQLFIARSTIIPSHRMSQVPRDGNRGPVLALRDACPLHWLLALRRHWWQDV